MGPPQLNTILFSLSFVITFVFDFFIALVLLLFDEVDDGEEEDGDEMESIRVF